MRFIAFFRKTIRLDLLKKQSWWMGKIFCLLVFYRCYKFI